MKGRRKIKKGGKSKDRVTHVSTIAPSYIYTPKYVDIPRHCHP